MKNFDSKRLSREEQRKVLGGLKNVNDDCPAGTHEFICVTGGGGLDGLIYIRYCVPDYETNPQCTGPA